MKKIKSFNKGFSERYEYIFSCGDYSTFNIDSKINKNGTCTGTMQITSSFGNFAYTWGCVSGCFKEFLCQIDDAYLLNKISNIDSFYFEDYIKQSKSRILKDRKNKDFSKEEARKFYDYYKSNMHNFEYRYSYDLTVLEFANSTVVNDVLDEYSFESEYLPTCDYPKNHIYFINNIYPVFIEELKKEIKQNKEEE
ncbi:hypothetical protein WG909_13035 [Peptostreptococcaceae bacterium AGR-M142]